MTEAAELVAIDLFKAAQAAGEPRDHATGEADRGTELLAHPPTSSLWLEMRVC